MFNIWVIVGTTVVILITVLLAAFLIKYRRLLVPVISMIPRDVSSLWLYLKLNIYCVYCKLTDKTVHKLFDEVVRKRPTKPCFLFGEQVWTYEKVQNFSYGVANYFLSNGFVKGDTVALFMENCPEYICIWIGLSRIGITTSLINYNLRLKSLTHCIEASNAKGLVFGWALNSAVKELLDEKLLCNFPLFCMQDSESDTLYEDALLPTTSTINLSKSLEATTDTVPPDMNVSSRDVILHIYTSGTTGLPKAVIMTHLRFISLGAIHKVLNLQPEKDIIMTPIPLYHIQGGVGGVSGAIFGGIPQVIIRKFSASQFWTQCIKYNVTACQYLGEVLRYLNNQPERPEEKQHKLKVLLGNGLNPSVWKGFAQRFKGIRIVEVYGSTEGNATLANLTGHVGACGFLPVWLYRLAPACLARVDPVTGDLLRDKKSGLAQHVKFNEVGEVLSGIIKFNPYREFTGYTDKIATEKKIVRDVKRKGDAYFRTGDMMEMDEYGYLYFKDRTGDTFRWKGENVSTAEVEEVLLKAAGMRTCSVYGVKVEGTEGRCGMAAISDPERSLDLSALGDSLVKSLPPYARPLFLRILNEDLEMTGTFKIPKVKLQSEGYNINIVRDNLYFLLNGASYVPLTAELLQEINTGIVKV